MAAMPLRPLRRAVALGAVGAAAVAVSRRRRALAAVAPELRSPAVWLPLSVRDERSLRIGRSLISRFVAPVAPGVTLTERTVPGGPALFLYEPEGRAEASGALLWIHGGGLVMGHAAQSHELCSALARDAGIVVANVEYRLAPEDPFPAGLDDCTAALRWLHDHAEELGADPDRLAIGGESAGGGLAAAVAQRARDEGGPPLALQLLVYPMLDDRTVRRDGPPTLAWTPASNRYAWGAYLGHEPGGPEERPYAVPARTDDLAGLPPAWIGVGSIDLFHDEDVAYAERLRAAGVEVTLHVVEGMYHAAEALAPRSEVAQRWRAQLVAALTRALG